MKRRTFLGMAIEADAPMALPFQVQGETVTPKIAGHRGAVRSGLKENTLAAFKYAQPYVEMLETDLRWTEDGKGVLSHDSTLSRVCGKSGYVKDYTLAELKEIGLTSFGQFLSYAATVSQLVSIEMKDPVGSPRRRKVLNYIAKYNIHPDRVIINSKSASTIKAFKKEGPEGLRTALGFWSTAPTLDVLLDVRPTYVFANPIYLTPTRCATYKYNGITPVAWMSSSTTPKYDQLVRTGASWVGVNDAKDFTEWLTTK